MPLLFFFLLWFLLEMMVFSTLIKLLSFGGALLLLLVSLVLGIAILRREQVKFLLKLQQSASGFLSMHSPSETGIYRVLAALLLIFPGFISDILALSLLFAPLRARFGLALLRAFKPERVVRGFGFETQSDSSYGYDGEVEARRADGSLIQGEILDAPQHKHRRN